LVELGIGTVGSAVGLREVVQALCAGFRDLREVELDFFFAVVSAGVAIAVREREKELTYANYKKT
jgi:hypothetical protein